ncbi:MAG: glycosyltransferase family 39 protein [Chloroflexota bacterium]
MHQTPPGLTHDEANNAHDAAGVLAGNRPIYFPTGYGHEPLYTYLVALISAPSGVTDTTLRLAAALCGLGVMLGSYALARRAFDPWVALATTAGLAISFWAVSGHRQGVRPVTLPLLFVPALFFLWRGLEEDSRPRHWLLAGLLAGGAFYTYLPSRTMLPSLLVFAVYLALFHRPVWRRAWRGYLLMLFIAAAVAAPLALHLIAHPAQESRVEQLIEPLAQAGQGNLEPLIHNALDALAVFSFTGDSQWRYNLPGRPVFDPITSIFLYLGLGLILWRWRQPACALLLLWLLSGLAPALITGAANSSQRMVGAQPAIYLILGLGVIAAARWLWARGRPGRWIVVPGLIALVAGNIWQTCADYFVAWAAEPDVREVYHTNLRQIAHYLDAQPNGGAVAISTEYPLPYHDPYVLEAILRRDDLALRWFDGRGALVIPAGGSEARYIWPAAANLHPALLEAFFDQTAPIALERLRPDDINNAFVVYRQTLSGPLGARLQHLQSQPVFWSAAVTFQPGDPAGQGQPLAWPVDLGHNTRLLGYELDRSRMLAGETLQLITYWRVLSPPPGDAVIFAHLLDARSQVRGGQDRLDAPTSHWQPGDVLAQMHTLTLDADATPGLYQLEIGVYATDDLGRWPVFDGGSPVADRLLLQPIEVSEP